MPVIVSWSLEDATAASRKSLAVFFPTAATDAEIADIVTNFTPLIDAASDAKIVGVSVTKAASLPAGLKANAVAGSDINRGALLKFAANNTAYGMSYWIPGAKDAVFTGDTVNDVQADAAALIAAFVSGSDGGLDRDPTDKYENDLTAYREGLKTFRK